MGCRLKHSNSMSQQHAGVQQLERRLSVYGLWVQGLFEGYGLGGRRYQRPGAKSTLQRFHAIKMKGTAPAPLVRRIPLHDFQGLCLDLPRVQE